MIDTKAAYVRALFDRIVGHYDLMNRLMSAGRDAAWRRRAAELAGLPAGGLALDVAAGTAELSLALARRYPTARIVALDFSRQMLALGQEKAGREPAGQRISFLAGDALRLPFPAGQFDAVTSAFLMRNVADIAGAFAEMRRVARPGGRVICLELTHPTLPVFRQLFRLFFEGFVPQLGRIVSRHGEAYRYLPQSLAQFVAADALKEIMECAGLVDVSYRRLMGGTVAIHVGHASGARASVAATGGSELRLPICAT